jgi:hypothetical protein
LAEVTTILKVGLHRSLTDKNVKLQSPIIFACGVARANPVVIEKTGTERVPLILDNYVLEIGIGRLISAFVNLFTNEPFFEDKRKRK